VKAFEVRHRKEVIFTNFVEAASAEQATMTAEYQRPHAGEVVSVREVTQGHYVVTVDLKLVLLDAKNTQSMRSELGRVISDYLQSLRHESFFVGGANARILAAVTRRVRATAPKVSRTVTIRRGDQDLTVSGHMLSRPDRMKITSVLDEHGAAVCLDEDETRAALLLLSNPACDETGC